MSDYHNGNGNGDLTEFKVDRRLMLEVMQRGKKRFVAVFVLAALLMLGYNVLILPQTFSSTVSFSMMQSQGGASPLLGMIGLGGGGKQSYLGVLKSRKFAETVAAQEQIQQFYKTESFDEAVEIVKKAVKVEENLNDGLITVSCTLRGPAKLARGQDEFRKQAAIKAANIANDYAHEMLKYLKNNDTDRDSTLLRQAEGEVRRQRQEYIEAVAGLQKFVKTSKKGLAAGAAAPTGSAMGTPAPSSSGMVGESGQLAAATAGAEIQQLYIRRATLEEQIQSLKAAREATRKLIENSGNGMSDLSEEDPLLAVPRAQVNAARNRVNVLSQTLGDENPRLVEARQALAVAEQNLKEKQTRYIKGQTSEDVKLTTAEADYKKVLELIERAEQNFHLGRQAMADYETQKNEVMLNLEALKTVSARYAEMRLSMVSAQNRMTIIDKALPAKYGTPGFGMSAILSLFVAIGAVAVWVGFSYLALALKVDSAIEMPVVENGHKNGH